MRAVALLLSVSLLGCFPHNAHHRTIAKLAEGGSLLAGIGLEAFVNTGADCDMMALPGMPNPGCHTKATVVGDIGVALILAGLLGFVATVSTAEDEKPPAPTIEIKADKHDLKLPPGVKAPAAAPAAAQPTDKQDAPSAPAPAHAAP
jgi:hypothetical protein